MADVLVLAAHPQMARSRVTRRLMQRAAMSALADAGPAEVRDLYALYPDYWIDVPAEQAALARARLVVWLHPVHWYGMPPLLRLWLDETFTFGWAYGPGGVALAGKSLWLVCSTGGPAERYRRAEQGGGGGHDWAEFLPPYSETAALTGMRWLPPLVLHGAHRADEAALAAHEAEFVRRLQAHAADAADASDAAHSADAARAARAADAAAAGATPTGPAAAVAADERPGD